MELQDLPYRKCRYLFKRLKRRYLAHVIRGEDEGVAKQAVFSDDYCKKSLVRAVIDQEICTDDQFYVMAIDKKI